MICSYLRHRQSPNASTTPQSGQRGTFSPAGKPQTSSGPKTVNAVFLPFDTTSILLRAATAFSEYKKQPESKTSGCFFMAMGCVAFFA